MAGNRQVQGSPIRHVLPSVGTPYLWRQTALWTVGTAHMALRGSFAIDLGTANTLIWVSGRGLVIDEPSAIALDVSTGKVAAVGEQADALAGKEPEDSEIISPLRDGVIADLNATALMLNGFLKRCYRHPGLLRPRALVCVPSRATWVERRSVAAALEARRPRAQGRPGGEAVGGPGGAGGGP